MNTERKLLCLPIELYKREMLPKLYLGINAAQKGYQVLLGFTDDPVFDHVKDGFYLYKDHAYCSIDRLTKQKSKNMFIGALDEEGLIYDEKTYATTRGAKELLDSVDAVFLWGENQFNLVQKISDKKDNKYIVGSPKFDLYKKLKRNIKNSNNKISILVNTRFVYSNGLKGEAELIEVLKNLGYIKNSADEQNIKIKIQDDIKIFNEFDFFINKISVNPLFDIVIRPHPAENLNFYKKYEKLSSNIKVDNESPMLKQILESDFIVHDGCTTAIEARALGVPVFGLRPDNLLNPYDAYANSYSFNFKSADSLLDFIISNDSQSWFDIMPEIDELARKRISNWNGHKSAVDEIIQFLDTLPINKQDIFSLNGKSIKIKFKNFNYKLLYIMSNFYGFGFIFKKILGDRKIEKFISDYYMGISKFSDKSTKQFNEDLEYLCDLMLCQKPNIIQVSQRSYLLYYNDVSV